MLLERTKSMTEKAKFFEPRNPLGLMTIFVILVETISCTTLVFLVNKESELSLIFAYFSLIVPSVILAFFLGALIFKREILYSPSDFREDSSFVELIKKVDANHVQLEALAIDPKIADLDHIRGVSDQLVSIGNIDGLLHLLRGIKKTGRHDLSNEVYERYSSDKRITEEQKLEINKVLGNFSVGAPK